MRIRIRNILICVVGVFAGAFVAMYRESVELANVRLSVEAQIDQVFQSAVTGAIVGGVLALVCCAVLGNRSSSASTKRENNV